MSYTTTQHRKTLEVNVWSAFTTADITDEFGTIMLPVRRGKWMA